MVVYWQKLGVAKQLKESQRELSGSNQMHRMLDTQHQAAMDELKRCERWLPPTLSICPAAHQMFHR